MKNKLTLLLFLIFFFQPLFAENLDIQSSKIEVDKENKLTVFKGDVIAKDPMNNTLKTEYAEYNKKLQLLTTKGRTTILTSEGYFITGENIVFDNRNNLIKSAFPTTVEDLEKNNIYLQKFEYSTEENFFKSVGQIEVKDSKDNVYKFSQIYIDEKKREILGTDTKTYLNQKSLKLSKKNKPRIFANTVKIDDEYNKFNKSVFTLCDYRKNDKCPPWSLQATEMTHDKKSKTIYYDNAVVKVYDIPIFYFPKLSHPDPSVKRRSGFLPPSFSDTKNLGPGFSIPYFFAYKNDRDLTFTSKLYTSEKPLFLGEYRQAFEKSNLILDFGYTEGYKKTSQVKKEGSKSHLFAQFVKNFSGKNNSENSIDISLQDISNDKYLKLYKINTDLIDHEIDTLENIFSFSHTKEDLFLGMEISAYETLKEDYNDKYEYILPDLTLDKNLFVSNKFGAADYLANFKVHNYDTNKLTQFFVNNIDWKYNSFNFDSGISGRLIGKLKNINYKTKNTSEFKDDSSELMGAVGYLSELNLFKNSKNNTNHLLSPKVLLRYAPGDMRKESNGSRLNHLNIFSLDRLNSYNNLESGLSATLGFDYELKNSNKKFNFSAGQIINKKENKNMPTSSSLDEKISDLVGNSTFKANNNLELTYNFSLDQNYNDLNYNEVGTNFTFNPISFNFNYLQEKKHIGNQEYFKAGIELAKSDNGIFSAGTKRNLVTNSAEYYNLSYEYLNDCLKAGLVYRREFYNDSELEPEDSLMFKITLVPFGNVNSPSFK